MRLGDEELYRRALEKLKRQVQLARRDTSEMFSFVMREETTREKLQCLPHQRLVFKFVAHFDRCVIRLPVGFSKTYTMSALTIDLLGKNKTARGAIISSTSAQAKKPLSMVRNYIESSSELRLVYPDLRPSTRPGDPWTQERITVDRPMGIRDPSVVAIGLGGNLPGSRLNWILVDDILDEENTSTEHRRDATHSWFNSSVMTRRDIKGTKIVVANTPWHPDDITYRLEAAGWPSLTIDIEGNVYFKNTCESDLVTIGSMRAPMPREGAFDCDDIRPSYVHFPEGAVVDDTRELPYRLTAHDSPKYVDEPDEKGRYVDADDLVPTWPEKFGRAEIEGLKQDFASALTKYNQAYMMRCRDEESGRVKQHWIENCKRKARERGIFGFAETWEGGNAFTGIDIAVGKKKKNDRFVVFTFAVLPDKHRQILRIDSGRISGSQAIDIIMSHYERYDSIMRVETNATQDLLRQWALERAHYLPLRPMPTGKNKKDPHHGVESLFMEIENGSWLIPNDQFGITDPAVSRFISGMLYYNPLKHTSDELMGAWMAREQARESGALLRGAQTGPIRIGTQMAMV